MYFVKQRLQVLNYLEKKIAYFFWKRKSRIYLRGLDEKKESWLIKQIKLMEKDVDWYDNH